ncbi:MAG: hypothetical protein D3907_06360, partial [Candidatus Electrothrix sp. AUS3]|nr:hypothetical protein [Candidatus Electrothrix gigas]
MLSLWNKQEADACTNELELRVYSSRLLGHDPSLVLHGGGNTSVKIKEKNVVHQEEEILYIKGSGWDLATIETEGFAPVRLQPMIQLAALDALTDPQMVNALKTQLTRANAPGPSVETILHAVLPFRYVDHTHADAVVTITNTRDGERRIQEIYGDQVVVIPNFPDPPVSPDQLQAVWTSSSTPVMPRSRRCCKHYALQTQRSLFLCPNGHEIFQLPP